MAMETIILVVSKAISLSQFSAQWREALTEGGALVKSTTLKMTLNLEQSRSNSSNKNGSTLQLARAPQL